MQFESRYKNAGTFRKSTVFYLTWHGMESDMAWSNNLSILHLVSANYYIIHILAMQYS